MKKEIILSEEDFSKLEKGFKLWEEHRYKNSVILDIRKYNNMEYSFGYIILKDDLKYVSMDDFSPYPNIKERFKEEIESLMKYVGDLNEEIQAKNKTKEALKSALKENENLKQQLKQLNKIPNLIRKLYGARR